MPCALVFSSASAAWMLWSVTVPQLPQKYVKLLRAPSDRYAFGKVLWWLHSVHTMVWAAGALGVDIFFIFLCCAPVCRVACEALFCLRVG